MLEFSFSQVRLPLDQNFPAGGPGMGYLWSQDDDGWKGRLMTNSVIFQLLKSL